MGLCGSRLFISRAIRCTFLLSPEYRPGSTPLISSFTIHKGLQLLQVCYFLVWYVTSRSTQKYVTCKASLLSFLSQVGLSDFFGLSGTVSQLHHAVNVVQWLTGVKWFFSRLPSPTLVYIDWRCCYCLSPFRIEASILLVK